MYIHICIHNMPLMMNQDCTHTAICAGQRLTAHELVTQKATKNIQQRKTILLGRHSAMAFARPSESA